MPALNSDGALAAGTFQQETELAWRHTMAIVEAAGYSVENIVYVQCVLADVADYSELNDWWRRQFLTAVPLRRASHSKRELFRSVQRSSSKR